MDAVNDRAHLRVAVRLDHGEGSLALGLELSPGVNIAVVGYFQDAGQNCNLSSKEEVIELDGGDLLLLEEDAVVLHVVHLN